MRKSLAIVTPVITVFVLLGTLLSKVPNSKVGQEKSSFRQRVVPAEAEARLRAIYEQGEFRAKSFRATWLKDGSGYTVLEPVAGSNGLELVRYDAAGGKRTVMFSLSQLIPQGESEPLSIENYEISLDGSRLLLQASMGEAEDRVSGTWILERTSGELRKVGTGRFNSISPDGRRILYSDQGNLHVYDIGKSRTIPITEDGIEDTISNRQAVWSPDGKRIAYVQRDQSDVQLRPVLVPTDPNYPEVEYVRYARVGGTIPTLRVGVVAAKGGKTRWLDISAPIEGFYLGQVSWAGNSDELLVEKLSRPRDKRDFLIANVQTGQVSRMYHESDPAWVVITGLNAGLEWIRGGSAFVVLSEKDGWRRAYIYSRDGIEQAVLTPGGADIIERVKVDEAGGWFYYYASPDNATQRYLYRVRLDGAGAPERITPSEQSGTHNYDFSPNAKWAFHTYSTFDTPPVTELVQLSEHRVVRVLEDNKDLDDKMKPLIAQPTDFLKLDIGDGVVMDAWMIKPRNFDPAKKYPVFVYVYGAPAGQTVLDKWGGDRSNYHRVIADLGYLVISMDSRGTSAPKGAAWRRALFRRLGVGGTEEQAAGLKELGRTRQYVDLSRVGIWGRSGGGSNTLNALFRKPDIFHVGIAVASKPQHHFYNAAWQETFMGTLEDNAEGYKQSNPINFAEGLKGNLLIVHGTGETNTHIGIVEDLIDRLIELGKQFDYMTYPNRNHGFREGKGTLIHLRMLMTRYLLTHLPSGPR